MPTCLDVALSSMPAASAGSCDGRGQRRRERRVPMCLDIALSSMPTASGPGGCVWAWWGARVSAGDSQAWMRMTYQGKVRAREDPVCENACNASCLRWARAAAAGAPRADVLGHSALEHACRERGLLRRVRAAAMGAPRADVLGHSALEHACCEHGLLRRAWAAATGASRADVLGHCTLEHARRERSWRVCVSVVGSTCECGRQPGMDENDVPRQSPRTRGSSVRERVQCVPPATGTGSGGGSAACRRAWI